MEAEPAAPASPSDGAVAAPTSVDGDADGGKKAKKEKKGALGGRGVLCGCMCTGRGWRLLARHAPY